MGDSEEAEGEEDDGRQYGDVLARDGEHVRDAGALERRLQVLGHERPVAEDHSAHHGCLARPETVAERHVGAAVHLADPTAFFSHRHHAGRLDERADSLGRQVPRVIEAVIADLGERDLAVHPHPVAHPDAEVAGEDLDAPAA